MASRVYDLNSPTELDCYIWLIAAANDSCDVLDAVNAYLASWTKERILSLQKIDAGWAPFGDDQGPAPVYSTMDIRRIGDAIRDQCVALVSNGIPLSPELVELDLFFSSANKLLSTREAGYARTATLAESSHRTGHRRSYRSRRHQDRI